MIDFSICIEMAFADDDRPLPDRVRAAADVGFTAVEIWDWRDKPLEAMADALRQTGTQLHTLCVENWRDKCQLGDPASHGAFVTRVEEAARAASALGVPKLVVLAGDTLPDRPLDAQRMAVRDALSRASDAIGGQPLDLLVEVVNRQFEGPNALLADSDTTVKLLRALGRPNVRYLYDRYHAILNGEALGWAIDKDMDLIGHVQAADVPGRHEFGAGTQDWVEEFAWLMRAGYSGYVGIEATLLGSAEAAVATARDLLRQAVQKVGHA